MTQQPTQDQRSQSDDTNMTPGDRKMGAKKKCILCSKKLPADQKHFDEDQQNADGFSLCCVSCVIDLMQRQCEHDRAVIKHKQRAIIKKCSNCGKYKLATVKNFPAEERYSDGLSSWCRDCQNAAARARYERQKGAAKDG